MLITPEYAALNETLHRANPIFGNDSVRWLKSAKQLIKDTGSKTFLDYGCGKSTLCMELTRYVEPFDYDPAVPGKRELPAPADVVFCTDVLEHVEPECIGEVLDHLASLSKKAFFAVVALSESNKTLPDGRNTHILIRSKDWWLGEMKNRFPGIQLMRHRNHLKLRFMWVA